MALRTAISAPPRTYATRERALQAFEKVCNHFDVDDMRYVIAVHTDGRYFAIALPRDEQMQVGIDLALGGGICTVRT